MERNTPDGFILHTRKSPLTEPWEPIFARSTDDRVELGLQIRPPHTNARGLLHGGLITALADNAMGLSCARKLTGEAKLLTASLSIDFLGLATLGQWLAVETDFVKTGRTLCFAQCFVKADGKPIARASASFAVAQPPK